MSITLVLTEAIADEFAGAARNPVETAGILLAKPVRDERGLLRLLARSMHWVPEHEYEVRNAFELRVAAATYIKPLAQAETEGEVAIWVHTHPNGGPPLQSEKDQVVDAQIAEVFRIRTGQDHYASLIISASPDGFDFTGRVETREGAQVLSRIWCVGNRWKLKSAFNESTEFDGTMFDRNVRAFGPAIQSAISVLKVAIIGSGGTGSAVAEQLVRLGVRNLILVDPDSLSESNVTRVYGSTPSDIGRPKVEVLKDHLSKIAPNLSCISIQGMITNQAVAKKLICSDVVFGCTDDNAGRIVLSRLSTYLLLPVIDCGVLISSDNSGQIIGIDGRITTLVPQQGCLICRGRVNLVRARTEMMSPDERIRLEDEGYAPVLGQNEPAVVTFTTSVAAMAVTELLERLIGFGPDPRPTEILMRFHEREISTNLAEPLGRHFCNPKQNKIGKGITEPFLEQVWA